MLQIFVNKGTACRSGHVCAGEKGDPASPSRQRALKMFEIFHLKRRIHLVAGML